MGALLDNLLASWKKKPDEQNTILLCEQLGLSGQSKLVDEVGKSASVKYASNPSVLVAIARMYMDAGRLGDAQGLFVSAGKMAPKNAEVYRWLGEVLLKRGDATRASKVLERAVMLGKSDDDTVFWRAQADAHVELQKESGAHAVVEAITAILIDKGLPPPPPPSRASTSRPPPPKRSPPPARPELSSDSDVTVVRQQDGLYKPAERSPMGAAAETPLEVPRRAVGSKPPPYAASVPSSPFAQVGRAATSAQPITVPPPTPRDDPAARMLVPPSGPRGPSPSEADDPPTEKRNLGPGKSDRSAPMGFGLLATPVRRPLAEASQMVGPSNALAPKEVLNALALTGVFEPAGGGASNWDTPAKGRTRFSITLVVLTTLLSFAGIGVLMYMRDLRAKQADEAHVIDAEISRLLRAGKVADLAITETKLSRA